MTIKKTYIADSPETHKELSYSLANADADILECSSNGNTFKVTFADAFAVQAWAHVFKQWFDRSPAQFEQTTH